MNRRAARWGVMALLGAVSMAAQAQMAYTALTVNLRAGPAPEYPVVYVVPAGMAVQVQGCLSDYSWCDVAAGPYRGWMYADYIDYAYQGQYVPLASYGPQLGIVIVSFVLIDYWGRFYVHEPFYRDRDRWQHYAPPPPRHPPAWHAPDAGPARVQPPPRVEPLPGVRPPPRLAPSPWVQPAPRVQPTPRFQPGPRVQPTPQLAPPPGQQGPREARPVAPQGPRPVPTPRQRPGTRQDSGGQPGHGRDRGPPDR